MLNKNKHNLIKLGELSVAGAVLAGLNVTNNRTKQAKALNINDQIFTNNETKSNVLNTTDLTHMMNTNIRSDQTVQITPKRSFAVSKLVTPANNGSFDASWGTLNAKDWQGELSEDGKYFVLTKYTGDPYHVIVPNAADLQAAGMDTQGKPVGVDEVFMEQLYKNLSQHRDGASIAFSKTDNQKVKALYSDWRGVFMPDDNNGYLTKFDGSGLDTSSITDMSDMFEGNKLSDLSSLSNWDTSHVTSMEDMFESNPITDLTPLKNWDVSNVTDMNGMFDHSKLSTLNGLENWNVKNVSDFGAMFKTNPLTDISAVKNWNISGANTLKAMFYNDQLSDLSPLSNWDTSNVKNMTRLFDTNKISDLMPLSNWKFTNAKKINDMLADNQISNLIPLKNWDVSNVSEFSNMFSNNQISDLTPLANWNTKNAVAMDGMFNENKLSDLTPLKNWNTSKATTLSNMFSANDNIRKADFSKWDFSHMTKGDEEAGTPSGLDYFIDYDVQRAVINLGDNSTMPDWFMQWNIPNPDDEDSQDTPVFGNQNIFTSSNGGDIILTSNPKLLANPNKAFNHISFLKENDNYIGDAEILINPVFINSTPDKILQVAHDMQSKTIDKFKQEHPMQSFDVPQSAGYGDYTQDFNPIKYDDNNPVDVLNAMYQTGPNQAIQHNSYSIKLGFSDKDSGTALDSNSVTIKEPKTGGTIDYSSFNDMIAQLQQKGYDVSNVKAHVPESIVSKWNDVDNVKDASTNSYTVTNDKKSNSLLSLTYKVSERQVKVTHDQPKTTSDKIDSTNVNYPKGVGQNDLNRTITRTITLHDENSKSVGKDIVQTVHMYRNATVNAVTGKVTYTDWTADGGFDSVNVPKIDGYTPDRTQIPKIDNLAPDQDYNTSVTYTHNNENVSISYVDDTTGKVIKTDTAQIKYGEPIQFKTNPSDYIKELQNQGYKVISNGFKDGTLASTDPTKNKFSVHFQENTVKVTHDAPKTTSDTIEGTTKNYPSGVSQDNFNKTITRTITFKDPNGNNVSKTVTQTVHAHRDATVNVVTGKVTYTDWTVDGGFDSIPVPNVDGYTPDKTDIPKVDNPDPNKDYNTSVIYSRNDENATITYVDDTTSKVLNTESVKAKFGDVIKFETTPSDYIKQLENKGYELVSNDYKDGVTASQNTTKNKFTVHVKHRLSKVERNKDVHEHINYNVTDANGKSANESSGSNPVLHFKQTGVKDEVTGKTDWNGTLDSQTFSSVNTIKRPGYVADITTIPAKTVTITNGNWNKNHDINTTVNYTPAEETVKMVVKDENGNVIQTIVKHGKFGEDYDFTNDKPKIDGYTFEKASDNIKGKFDVNNKDIVLTYKKNETKKPEKPVTPTKPSKPQRTPEDTSIFGKNIEAQKDDQGLPEMAENKSGLVAAGLGIASLAGLTGLAGVQIKKRRS